MTQIADRTEAIESFLGRANSTPDFEVGLAAWTQRVNEFFREYWKREGYVTGVPYLDPVFGSRYVKMIRKETGSSHSASAFAFVEIATGDIFKPASYRAPAKHARGNINDAKGGMAWVSPWGIASIR